MGYLGKIRSCTWASVFIFLAVLLRTPKLAQCGLGLVLVEPDILLVQGYKDGVFFNLSTIDEIFELGLIIEAPGGWVLTPIPDTVAANVTYISLDNANLTGPIPDNWPFYFPDLRIIRLNKNSLQGSLPAFWTALSQVEEIMLEYNDITGTLPPEWGKLTKLRKLKLQENLLNSTLPEEWAQLSSIEHLNLGYNYLHGSLPAVWSQLSNLQNLTLADNLLSGTLPAEWMALGRVERLHMEVNNFTGSLPPEWATGMFNLVELQISTSRITGPLPPEYHQLQRLELIQMRENMLTGTIPAEYAVLPLKFFAVRNNMMEGTVPPQWENLTDLDNYSLRDNFFTGTLPPGYAKLQKMKAFQWNNNGFHGTLPPEWGAITNIKNLYLNNNSLTGTLPREWNQLASIATIFLNDNKLEGTLPPEWRNMSSMTSLYLHNNSFVGTIPPEWSEMSLSTLRLHVNHLEGTLPWQLGRLNLTILNLHSNKFSGTLPAEWGGFGKMQVLTLDNNSLSGGIPESWANMLKLETLKLWHNQLEDQGFRGWDEMVMLKELDVDGGLVNLVSDEREEVTIFRLREGDTCVQREAVQRGVNVTINFLFYDRAGFISDRARDVSGDVNRNRDTTGLSGEALFEYYVPYGDQASIVELVEEAFVQHSEFQTHFWSSNKMAGILLTCQNLNLPIGEGLGLYPSLEHIDLTGTNIYGQIPNDWASLKKLRQVQLGYNRLSGVLSPTWGLLTSLHRIELHANSFHGRLPDTWTNLSSLAAISLARNRLSGDVNRLWAALPSLQYMDLSHNSFSGIPAEWREKRQLNKVNLLGNDINQATKDDMCNELVNLQEPSAFIISDSLSDFVAAEQSAWVDFKRAVCEAGSRDLAVILWCSFIGWVALGLILIRLWHTYLKSRRPQDYELTRPVPKQLANNPTKQPQQLPQHVETLSSIMEATAMEVGATKSVRKQKVMNAAQFMRIAAHFVGSGFFVFDTAADILFILNINQKQESLINSTAMQALLVTLLFHYFLETLQLLLTIKRNPARTDSSQKSPRRGFLSPVLSLLELPIIANGWLDLLVILTLPIQYAICGALVVLLDFLGILDSVTSLLHIFVSIPRVCGRNESLYQKGGRCQWMAESMQNLVDAAGLGHVVTLDRYLMARKFVEAYLEALPTSILQTIMYVEGPFGLLHVYIRRWIFVFSLTTSQLSLGFRLLRDYYEVLRYGWGAREFFGHRLSFHGQSWKMQGQGDSQLQSQERLESVWGSQGRLGSRNDILTSGQSAAVSSGRSSSFEMYGVLDAHQFAPLGGPDQPKTSQQELVIHRIDD